MTCEHCDEGNGKCAYPMYGVAPHNHSLGPVIRSTVIKPEKEWPENFQQDPDEPTCGVYLWCPECGCVYED